VPHNWKIVDRVNHKGTIFSQLLVLKFNEKYKQSRTRKIGLPLKGDRTKETGTGQQSTRLCDSLMTAMTATMTM
jgi:hypothetical protein